jgi:hypothetical protein
VRVVLTVRDDFLLRLESLPALRARLGPGLQLLTTPLEPELRRILTEPLRRAGYEFDDPALPDRIVDEVAGTPGALALLSFTASKLWELRDRRFRCMACTRSSSGWCARCSATRSPPRAPARS